MQRALQKYLAFIFRRQFWILIGRGKGQKRPKGAVPAEKGCSTLSELSSPLFASTRFSPPPPLLSSPLLFAPSSPMGESPLPPSATDPPSPQPRPQSRDHNDVFGKPVSVRGSFRSTHTLSTRRRIRTLGAHFLHNKHANECRRQAISSKQIASSFPPHVVVPNTLLPRQYWICRRSFCL